jgi:hypothetical protein
MIAKDLPRHNFEAGSIYAKRNIALSFSASQQKDFFGRIWKAERAVQGSGLIGRERSPSILIVLVHTDSTTDDCDDYAISAIDWNEE